MALAEKLCLAGRPDQALKLAGRVATLEEELAARARQTPPWLTPAVRTPETTPELAFAVGRAYLLQGRVEDAVGRLEAAARLLEAEAGEEGRSRLGRALGWLSYGYELLGELNKAEAALARAPDGRPGAGEGLAAAREVGEAAGLTGPAGRR
jgi:tetratricopeptide (TPR) repeat protein